MVRPRNITKGPANPSANPPYVEMIKHALQSLRVPGPASRKGVSAQAIKAFIAGNYSVDMNTKVHVFNRALKKAIATGNVIHTKGLTGAVGCFKLPPTNPSRPIHQIKSTNITKKKESTKKKDSSNKKGPSKLPPKFKDPRKGKFPAKAPRKCVAQ